MLIKTLVDDIKKKIIKTYVADTQIFWEDNVTMIIDKGDFFREEYDYPATHHFEKETDK